MTLSATPPAGLATLTANARTVLEKRYLIKDERGKPTETPEDLFWRVATVVAEADAMYEEGLVLAQKAPRLVVTATSSIGDRPFTGD